MAWVVSWAAAINNFMATYLVGTANPGKIAEIRALLKDVPHTLKFLSDFSQEFPEVEESGQSYEENALIKAKAYSQLTHVPTFSEDAGLEVHALDNFPGIQSNRWSVGSDEGRITGILGMLDKEVDRSAHFTATVVLYDPQTTTTHSFVGRLDGTIATAPAGDQGFGYDPIFIPKGESKTMAELGVEWKNHHSHRAVVWKLVADFLKKQVS